MSLHTLPKNTLITARFVSGKKQKISFRRLAQQLGPVTLRKGPRLPDGRADGSRGLSTQVSLSRFYD